MSKGANLLQWRPELGVKIGVLNRNNNQLFWIETEPFFVFHFANAYEEDNCIIVDYVRHAKLNLEGKPESHPSRNLCRTIIDLTAKKAFHQPLDERVIEFPRINDGINANKHRYIYAPARTHAQHFSALIKYDVDKRTEMVFDFGDSAEIGEAVFIPRSINSEEDDGYIVLFVYNKVENNTYFVILNAADFTAGFVAKIKLPRRVPHGLHGSWMNFTRQVI